MPTTRFPFRRVLAMLALSGAACATTASDIHHWGDKHEYARVCETLRNGAPPDDVRAAVADVIGAANYPPAIPDLVRLSEDPSPPVRRAAVRALGQYAGREVYGAILRASGDDDAETGRIAKSALLTWGDESVDFVLDALNDSDYRVRVSAVQVLGRLKDPRVGPALCKRARIDESALVRKETARSLGALTFGGCRDVLYRLKTSDPSSEVQVEAEAALNAVGKNITAAKFLIVPPAQLPDGVDASFRDRFEAVLAQRIVEARLGEVLPPAAPCANPVQEASRLARESNADQIISATLLRDGNRLTLLIDRLSATGTTLQEDQATDLDTHMDALMARAVDLLVQRFGQ